MIKNSGLAARFGLVGVVRAVCGIPRRIGLVDWFLGRVFGVYASDGLVLMAIPLGPEESLREFFGRHGSDKGLPSSDTRTPYSWSAHNYADLYDILLAPRRYAVKTLVECGIGTNCTDTPSNMGASGVPGASLRAWRDYFPLAQIFGLDIDERVLFEEERISTFRVDQTVLEDVSRFWNEASMKFADIIIDDGLHTPEAAGVLFQGSFSFLVNGGLYIVEDVDAEYVSQYRELLKHGDAASIRYFGLHRSHGSPQGNGLIVIQKVWR